MQLSNAAIKGANQRLAKTIEQRGEFGARDYTLTGRSLHQIARCPGWWHRRGAEEDQRTSALSEAVWTLLVMPAKSTEVLAVRPEKYQKLVMACPKCGSMSQAKHCKNCDVDRHPKQVEVHWSRQIADCKVWEDRAVATGHVVMSTPEFDRAQRAVTALTEPPAVPAMLAAAERGVIVTGTIRTDAGKNVNVVEPVLAIPPESEPDGDSIYLLDAVVSTNPGLADSNLEWRGAATRGALALDLVNAATEGVRRRVRVLVAGLGTDGEPAYCELSNSALQDGRSTYGAGAACYVAGANEGVWPGYDTDGQGHIAWRIIDPQLLRN